MHDRADAPRQLVTHRLRIANSYTMDRLTAGKALLTSLGGGSVRHSGKTLFNHLLATHDLLKAWEAPESLCLAGLFHSVYGTEGFQLSIASTGRRELISDTIGPEAERLAWIFGVMKQASFWSIIRSCSGRPFDPDGYRLIDRLTNERVPCTADECASLASLTLANALDQAVRLPERYGLEKCRVLSLLVPYVLPRGAAAFGDYVATLQATAEDPLQSGADRRPIM
jgi:hypothetical protein